MNKPHILNRYIKGRFPYNVKWNEHTCEQNDMSLNWRSNITLFRSRLISSNSFPPTWINIVLFRCSVAEKDFDSSCCNFKASVLITCCIIFSEPELSFLLPARAGSYTESLEPPTEPSSDMFTISNASDRKEDEPPPVRNASSDPELEVRLWLLSLSVSETSWRVFVVAFCWLELPIGATLSRSAGKLWTLASLSWRSRRLPALQSSEAVDYKEQIYKHNWTSSKCVSAAHSSAYKNTAYNLATRNLELWIWKQNARCHITWLPSQ